MVLTFGQQLIGKPVLSLRTGTPIGAIVGPLINPENLKIEGWYASEDNSPGQRIILSQDIREIIRQGFVVNDLDALTPLNELVRLQGLLDLKYELVGKPVRTESNQKLGKVSDFTFNREDLFVQKLYLTQSIVKNFSGAQTIIDRDQIVEINDKFIVVSDATVSASIATSPNAA